jgi:dolichol kinase
MFFSLQKILLRKLLHVGLALFFLALSSFLQKKYFLLTIPFFFSVFLYTKIRFDYLNVHKKSFGEFFFLLGVFVAFLLSYPNIELFQMSLVILGFADAFAGIFGTYFGKNEYFIFKERRTAEGSFVFFITSLLICLFFGQTVFMSFFASLILLFVENTSPHGLDNFLLPVLTVALFNIY